MKNAIIYGEFLEESTTGIAYINSLLEKVLYDLGYAVSRYSEPRAKDYKNIKEIVNKKFYFKDFIKIMLSLLMSKNKEISFITISQSNLGLIKTLIISIILKYKTKRLIIYVHRGDLKSNLNKFYFRKFLINLIFSISFRVIFLSKILSEDFKDNYHNNKFLIIPNSLNKRDNNKSKILYETKFFKINVLKENTYRAIYCGNIHSQKGIDKIILAIKQINKNYKHKNVILDVYGIPFEKINEINNQIQYKGILNYHNRLEIMSEYDFLITASKSEGMPLILIECLSIGLPFITTEVGAIKDILIKDYPYICTCTKKSIVNTIINLMNDFDNQKEKLKKIISHGNKLYRDNFQYKNYYSNIKKNIFLD